MKITPTEIPDVKVIEPKVFDDDRGFFMETYRKNLFAEHGIDDDFTQDNHSHSQKGVLRGLHFQNEPHAQSKLVRVLSGEIFDVAVDIRKGSPTYGKHIEIILSAENKKMLYIPAGFAHGFCVVSDTADFAYKVSNYYNFESQGGIIWNDPTLNIQWPKLDCDYILSEKDLKYPELSSAG